MPKRSWKHPEDGGKPIPPPMLYAGGEPWAYRVIGRDGWPKGDAIRLLLEQDWDDAVGGTTGSSQRHYGVIRRQAHVEDLRDDQDDPLAVAVDDLEASDFVEDILFPPGDPGGAMRDALDAAMATLTDRQREVVEMVALGHSDRTVADMLGCGYANVFQHRTLAFRKLRAALDTTQP